MRINNLEIIVLSKEQEFIEQIPARNSFFVTTLFKAQSPHTGLLVDTSRVKVNKLIMVIIVIKTRFLVLLFR